MATSSGTVAIILMKPLAQAKTRLSPGLDPKERMSLTGNLLRRVLRATVWPVPTSPRVSALASVWVVGGDPQVCRIAHEEGATWREEEGSDMKRESVCSLQESNPGRQWSALPSRGPSLH